MVSRVYFFIPNIIGYLRVALAVAAFVSSFSNHYVFFVCYAISEILDAVDGHAARYFNQASRYGAVLDMVTDRCATTALIMILGYFYREFILGFILIVALDITSHYAHLYSTLVRRVTSHKTISEKQSPLLRVYYSNRLVLGSLCLGNEAFFLLLYLAHFTLGSMIPGLGVPLVHLLIYVAAVPMSIKQLMNVVQLWQAAVDIVEIDEQERKKA